MAKKLQDREIVYMLSDRIGATPKDTMYDNQGRVIALNLSQMGLSYLPSEIWQLTMLTKLDLNNNRLTYLPSEIRRLRLLRTLEISDNELTQLPVELGQLTNVEALDLSGNRLTTIPSEFASLTKLHLLLLHDNQLRSLPSELGNLINLQHLYLQNNRLSNLPSELALLSNLRLLSLDHNQIASLPPDLAQLSNLQLLWLNDNQLNNLPSEFALLSSLQQLWLKNNQLPSLPPEFAQLSSLSELSLDGNLLAKLPRELTQLSNLTWLAIPNNHLTSLPPEIAQLSNLRELWLHNNHLSSLPTEIAQLANLHTLSLNGNQLTSLPPEISQLTNLHILALDDNPDLLSPPPEIVARGTQEILAFLRELHETGTTRYEAKLLVVGEGEAGKSSLLRALRGDAFVDNLPTTHGIEVNQYQLPNPENPEQPITLNTWDFGGQQIYHATHQFFLTQRSLYVLVWNARLGAAQCRLEYWLETIKALAPNAPVLLVATRTDDYAPDLNYQQYKEAYPQLVGHVGVSNKTGEGIEELQQILAAEAGRLPLMGQPWPQRWIDIEQALLARREHHIDAEAYEQCCAAQGVEAEIAQGTLGNYLHDLGKILYFRDDHVLSDFVVLKPNWITKAISRVLTDKVIGAANGILPHSSIARIWDRDEDGQRYERRLHPIFLRLMERFELSYQLSALAHEANTTQSLIPQLLPHQPPDNIPIWRTAPPDGQSMVEMFYRLDFVPEGLMSRFIVRTHPYTTDQHWREGVILKYEQHQARAELNPMLREIRLQVWGPLPQNFFTILRETLDDIFKRFVGLPIRREVPCICHRTHGSVAPCPRFHRYQDLVRRMEAGKEFIECNDSFERVSVPTLLYGIHTSTDRQVMHDIKQGQEQLRAQVQQNHGDLVQRLAQQSELIGREFTRLWNLEMQKLEVECPSTFFLMPGDRKPFNPKNWVSQEYTMYLVCQHPPGPHQAHGGGYQLRQSAEWWATVSPWLIPLIKFLRYGVPIGIAGGKIVDEAIDRMAAGADMLERMANSLEQLDLDSLKRATMQPRMAEEHQAVGPALRALYSFLKEADPQCIWGGLYKTPTPDGNILWLCDEHRQPYLSRPLVLPDLEPAP